MWTSGERNCYSQCKCNLHTLELSNQKGPLSGTPQGLKVTRWRGQERPVCPLAPCLSAESGAQPEEAAVTQDAGCFVLALVSRNWIFFLIFVFLS